MSDTQTDAMCRTFIRRNLDGAAGREWELIICRLSGEELLSRHATLSDAETAGAARKAMINAGRRGACIDRVVRNVDALRPRLKGAMLVCEHELRESVDRAMVETGI